MKSFVRTHPINASDGPRPTGGYAQAIEIRNAERLLVISGQIPEDKRGSVPHAFGDQCRLVWANIEAQLRAAGLSFDHLVKVTTYLGDRRFAEENGAVRRQLLGARTLALTVVIAGIYDERWLVEIEAIAAA